MIQKDTTIVALAIFIHQSETYLMYLDFFSWQGQDYEVKNHSEDNSFCMLQPFTEHCIAVSQERVIGLKNLSLQL
jgi:hypothetical protein